MIFDLYNSDLPVFIGPFAATASKSLAPPVIEPKKGRKTEKNATGDRLSMKRSEEKEDEMEGDIVSSSDMDIGTSDSDRTLVADMSE